MTRNHFSRTIIFSVPSTEDRLTTASFHFQEIYSWGTVEQLVPCSATYTSSKLTIDLASLDIIGDILGAAAVDLAADRESSTEDLQDGSAELLGEAAVTHGAGDLDDVVQRDGLAVLDVLLLLAVTRGLLEGLDDQGGSGGNNRDLSLTVLDGEPDGHTETFLYPRRWPISLMPCCFMSLEVLTQSPVFLAISSPIFLGDRPRGPTLGAKADWAPTSPPVTLRWLRELLASLQIVAIQGCSGTYTIFTSLGSNLGATHKKQVSRQSDGQGDDTYAWRVRKVVNRPWNVERVMMHSRRKREW